MESSVIFSKSFSRHEQRKFGYCASLGSFVLALSSFYLLKPYFDPLVVLNLPLSMGTSLPTLVTVDRSSSQQSNVANSEPSNARNFQQLHVGSSQALTSNISQKSSISNSHQALSTSSSQQSNISSSQQPSNINGNSHEPLNTRSTSKPSVSDGDITLEVVERKPICDVSNPDFDYCDAGGDIRIHGISSTVFAVSSSQMDVLVGNDSWTVQPYVRKSDKVAMKSVKEFTVKSIGFGEHEEAPLDCTLNHSVPAIIFSTGGYAGNHFHAISDIIIPLFVASAQFQGEVQFLVTTIDLGWINKFQAILKLLSKYEIINIDIDEAVHCFPRVIVGLKQYKGLTIDPLMTLGGQSMKELFKQLLRKAYSLKRSTAIKIGNPTPNMLPRILILSRKWSRTFENVDEIAEMGKSLGFEVVVSEATMNLEEFAQVVNSCDVMLGVHGAGLTNLVFLPDNAILIQVLPWGGYDWVATNAFGQPALDMNLRHLEYKIKEEESSLIQQYPLDHPVFRDPASITKHNWFQFKSLYMDKQNVKIDVERFRPTLLEALELLHH